MRNVTTLPTTSRCHIDNAQVFSLPARLKTPGTVSHDFSRRMAGKVRQISHLAAHLHFSQRAILQPNTSRASTGLIFQFTGDAQAESLSARLQKPGFQVKRFF
jgi:hypothetical protein